MTTTGLPVSAIISFNHLDQERSGFRSWPDKVGSMFLISQMKNPRLREMK
jgi:hypothetical protein